jgi:hypothetical protein
MLKEGSLLQFYLYFLLSLASFIFVNAGFRSRVKYFSIVDPTQMAYYVSEILDAGRHGPMFMVTFRNCVMYTTGSAVS